MPSVPGVHEATAVGPVLSVSQVVVTQLLVELADEAVHEATGTLVVLFGEQVVVVQLLPKVADEALHDWTGSFVVLFAAQVVAVVPLVPALQLCAGPLLRTCGAQVVVTNVDEL